MNAGAHGGETTDVFVEARGIDRRGNLVRFDHGQMGFSYRHCAAPEDVIFTSALFEGRPGDRAAIEAEMDRVTAAREAAQPIRERTGGSTFANPEGGKAWQLVDAAGCRGLTRGGAQVSEMHCNFLINRAGPPPPTSKGSARRSAAGSARPAVSRCAGRSSGSACRCRLRPECERTKTTGAHPMTRHVAVLMGGSSAEREVSLNSGKCADALEGRGSGSPGSMSDPTSPPC